MINIDDVRNNAEDLEIALKGRGDGLVRDLLRIDTEFRNYTTKLQAAESERNSITKAIGEAFKLNAPTDGLKAMAKDLGEKIAHYKNNVELLTEVRNSTWAKIPNVPDPAVPDGGEENNQVIFQRDIPEFNFEPKEHFDIPGLDFETGVKLAGTRFTTMTGTMAKLHLHLLHKHPLLRQH